LLRWRPDTTDKTQVLLGRFAMVGAAGLGIAAAYLVAATPDGLYKYLQTISLYLVMPVAPTVAFGILSKRVTAKGAMVSVVAGSALATLFVTDQLIGPARGAALFPWLHYKLTLNYTFRGFCGAVVTSIILFAVSHFTEKVPPERLEKLTIDWRKRIERFSGISNWRC
jgi:SSS family solute:Na+ symporter